jgi:hypothetical protein
VGDGVVAVAVVVGLFVDVRVTKVVVLVVVTAAVVVGLVVFVRVEVVVMVLVVVTVLVVPGRSPLKADTRLSKKPCLQ